LRSGVVLIRSFSIFVCISI